MTTDGASRWDASQVDDIVLGAEFTAYVSRGQSVIAYGKDGTKLWETDLGALAADFYGELAVSNAGILWANDSESSTDRLFALDTATGEILTNTSARNGYPAHDASVDADGNYYLTSGDDLVEKITPDGTRQFSVSVSDPRGVCVDSTSEYFFVHANGADEIQKRSTGDGSLIATRTFTKYGVSAVDQDDNLYFADAKAGKFDFDAGTTAWTVSFERSPSDIEYRPDVGTFVYHVDATPTTYIERIEDGTVVSTVYSESSLTFGEEILAAFPSVGGNPTAWEPAGAVSGLQSEQTDVSSTTTAPTVSAQAAPRAELTPTISTPEKGAGTASTTPTLTPATAAPTLNTGDGVTSSVVNAGEFVVASSTTLSPTARDALQ